jgi:flagellar hook-associated protein 2
VTNSITFSGLASGMDTQAIIDAMMSIAKAPVDRLQAKRQTYATQLSTLSDLASRLSSLRTTARGMQSASTLKAYSAQSADPSTFTAAAGSGALPGTYDIEVQALAQATRAYSFAVNAKDQTGLVGTGNLTLTIGGTALAPIAINEATDTLETVAQKINDAGGGASASIIYTGSVYKLVVNGTQTGQANAVTFAEAGTLATKLGLSDAGAAVQTASDARIVIDKNTITSSSNQMSQAIPGVNLTLLQTTALDTTVKLTVSLDASAEESKINTLLGTYNSVMSLLKDQLSYSGAQKDGQLIGDAALRGIKSQLQSIITGKVDAAGAYSALSLIGVVTNKDDGTLSLNSTAFHDALAKDPESVSRLLTYNDFNTTTDNDGVMVRLGRTIDSFLATQSGTLTARQDGIQKSIASIDTRVASLQRNLDTYETGLRTQYAALESLMAGYQSQGNYLTAQASSK